ncbi:hypothetical protein OAJ60_04445 [Planctomycetaceae bacterium]|nr:hypothetical protein [Planctomycetaceae bacterium]
MDSELGFQVKFQLGKQIRCKASFQLEDEALRERITKGDATFAVRIECPTTYFQETVTTESDVLEHSIAETNLRGVVSIEPRVVACREMDDYAPSDAHPDYGDEQFRISRGQLLAIGDTRSIFIEKDFDPLRMPTNSLIRVQKDDDLSPGPYEVQYELDERITVSLSHQDWDAYQGIKRTVPQAILSMIAVPVLAEAVRLMFHGGDVRNYEELLWFQRLNQILTAREIPTDNPLSAVQTLLEAPLNRALVELETEIHEGRGEEE